MGFGEEYRRGDTPISSHHIRVYSVRPLVTCILVTWLSNTYLPVLSAIKLLLFSLHSLFFGSELLSSASTEKARGPRLVWLGWVLSPKVKGRWFYSQLGWVQEATCWCFSPSLSPSPSLSLKNKFKKSKEDKRRLNFISWSGEGLHALFGMLL